MPVALTFNSLITYIQATLERGGSVSDPTVFNQLPFLINNAERAIARRLKILGMNVPVISTLVAGTPVYVKPSGWRRTISMNYGAGAGQNAHSPIWSRSYEYCRQYWPDPTQLKGANNQFFYSDYDYQHWLIVPTPDVNYPWEILYYGLPSLLDNTNQTNYWTDFAPETVSYRALLECTPFLKNDERIPIWEKRYEEGIQGLENEDLILMADRAAVRKED